MEQNYILVLFKNKTRKKIIKGYQTLKRATSKFKELTDKKKIFFPIEYENAEKVNYELALLTKENRNQRTIFTSDDYGRNVLVFLENESQYVFLEIKKYQKEEKIFDWQKQKRIHFLDLIKTYCSKKEVKNIFTLNNKLIVQIDENLSLFSLKNPYDSQRLLKSIEDYFRQENRKDAIFVRDISTVQRKWLYNTLVEMGFDKSKLYRQKTTFSKRT
jgi:hypothetical protein